MIKANRVLKYTTEDGQQFDSLDGAQSHELIKLLSPGSEADETSARAVALILNHRDDVLSILRQKERKNASPATAKPRKPRTSRKAATPEPATP